MNLACVKKRSNCTTLTRLVHGCRQMMINRKSKYIYIYLFARFLERWLSNPRTYKQNHSPRRGTRGRGGWNPSPEFLICCSILKRFYLQCKPFDLLNKMRYILWVVALLKACDVTNNGRHLGRHLEFYQELETG